MKKSILNFVVVSMFLLQSCGPTQTKVEETDTSEPTMTEVKQSVFFESPQDGATVGTTFKVAIHDVSVVLKFRFAGSSSSG